MLSHHLIPIAPARIADTKTTAETKDVSLSHSEQKIYDCRWLNRCERFEKHGQTHIKVTLKQAIELSKNSILEDRNYVFYSDEHADPKEHISIKLKESKEVVTFSINNESDFNDVTLLDICHLSKRHLGCAQWILQHLPMIEEDEYLLSPAIKQFIGSFSYQELSDASIPEFLTYILTTDDHTDISTLRNYFSPQILADYTHTLLEQLDENSITDCLLQPMDFKEAAELSRYSEINPVCEGYWPNDEARQLLALQHKTSGKEAKPWKNRDKLIACLEALEEMAMNFIDDKRKFVSKYVPEEIVNQILPFNVSTTVTYMDYHNDHIHNPKSPPLPLKKPFSPDGKAFSVTFPDEKGNSVKLTWMGELKSYIEEYNIIPSAEFLQKFESFLTACRVHYQHQADLFSTAIRKQQKELSYQETHYSRDLAFVTQSRLEDFAALQKKVTQDNPTNLRDRTKKALLERIITKINSLEPPSSYRTFKCDFLIQLASALKRLNLDNPEAVQYFKEQYILPASDSSKNRAIFNQINQFGGSQDNCCSRKLGYIGAFFSQIGNNRPGTYTATRLLICDVGDFIESYSRRLDLRLN